MRLPVYQIGARMLKRFRRETSRRHAAAWLLSENSILSRKEVARHFRGGGRR